MPSPLDTWTCASPPKYVAVNIDAQVAYHIDKWRQFCPSVNRTALVNQILMDWAIKNPTIDDARGEIVYKVRTLHHES